MSSAPTATEILEGAIERIIFHNPENGFVVLAVRNDDRREAQTLVGHLVSPREGDDVRATGQWVLDPKRGRQFKADRIDVPLPTSREAIVKYLGSGQIKGIGPSTAQQLVKKFGEGVFEVIEKQPQRLREIKGLGKARIEKIQKSWETQRAGRDTMMFLQEHGIGAARATRVYKRYGSNAIDQVKENPWRLAADIDGIGFLTADAVGRSLGFNPRSPLRARAGLHYCLDELAADGHCAYPETRLIDDAASRLDIDPDTLRAALDNQLAERRLVRDAPFDEPWIYRRELYDAERRVAERLRALSTRKHPLTAVNTARALAWVERQTGLKLAPAQRDAIAMSTQKKVMVITGGPGVGKTTIVNAIIRIFLERKCEPVLCAPTGRAAKRLSETTGRVAKTVHRLLEFNPEQHDFARNEANPLEGGLFIVDESSMMDVRLMASLLDAIPNEAAVLLVGDVDQLPSVGPGRVLADVINSGAIPTVRLTHIFRQGPGSRIVDAAHAVNRGELPDLAHPAELSDFYFIEAAQAERVQDAIVDLVTDRIPARFGFDPCRDVQVLSPMNKHALGARHLTSLLQERLNRPAAGLPELLRFGVRWRTGDKVMQIVNNYDKDVFNGDVGFISGITPDGPISVDFDGKSVDYAGEAMDELMLAYAVSIHKSQGSEYPAVVVALHDSHSIMLQRNLIYTAMTRGKKLVCIVGTRRALQTAVARVDSVRRHTALARRLRLPWVGQSSALLQL